MKRPAVIIAMVALHLLLVCTLAGLAIYLVWLTRTPEILNDKNAADAIRSLKIGALVLAAPVVLWLPAVYGLWKRRLWGWWLALITGAGVATMLLYSAVDDGQHRLDADDAAIAALCAMLPLILLLPGVRKYYRKPYEEPVSPVSALQDAKP